MRLANIDERSHLVLDGPGSSTPALCVDLARASAGRWPADPQTAVTHWDDVRKWAEGRSFPGARPLRLEQLAAPVPRPRQIFALGLNYLAHAEESMVSPPSEPMVFTKFPTSLTGPSGAIALTGDRVDWEVELVVVIGRTARQVAAADAWGHVAGLTVGQDISDRTRQFADSPPQFSLAKSFPGFGPIGPWLVDPRDLPDPDDLAIRCEINGEVVQEDRTSSMIFGVAETIARLSGVLPLLPGDLLFMGTPAGVGIGRRPERYLRPGDRLVSSIEGIGSMAHSIVAGPATASRSDARQTETVRG